MGEKQLTDKQDVIFFFGAGASVDAGIPDTYTFAKDFEDYIKSKYMQLYPALLKIIERRELFNKKDNDLKPQVDVEQLLDTLRRLTNKDKEPLLDFYDEKKFCPMLDVNACLELKNILENFIRKKVIVRDSKKLDYLKELLKFDAPLEIYSTNYDTCIEQLSYLTFRRYTDGFNIDWSEKNFEEYFDIKHYKLHGSVIWFENVKTKQCVKIPAQAFYDGKPVELKLVYGEDIKPLLLYPAQKVEYVEPLTDLQVMFKHRLFDKSTKYVIFVGYSFKDEYIARMLWDASRVNENLHVILISPNAQEIFEDKLRYVNREKKDPSRIQDRVICLPYTFKSIIFQIKNHYIEILRHISDEQEKVVEEERKGHHVENQWRELLFQCIEAEFLSKAEYILEEKLRKDWDELPFNDLEYKTRLSFKSLLHSVITKDEYVDRWIKRLNGLLEILDAKKLRVRCDGVYAISFSFNDYEGSQKIEPFKLINILLTEWTDKIGLLSPKFEVSLERISGSIKKLKALKDHMILLKFCGGYINTGKYLELRSENGNRDEIESLSMKKDFTQEDADKLQGLVLESETKELERIFGAQCFQFKLEDVQ